MPIQKKSGNLSYTPRIYIYIYIYIVVTHSKSAQDRLFRDVLGVLTSVGSSNIISDPTETIIPTGDHSAKSSPSTQNTPLKNRQNATAIELLNWKWPIRNDVRHFPPSRDELNNHLLVIFWILYEYIYPH